MKICVISSTVFAVPLQGYGGLEILAWQQAKGLAAKGHQVTLVAPDGSECPGAAVFPTGPAGRHGEEHAYAKYWPLLPEHDVVIDHSWAKWSLSLKAEGRLDAPCLCVCHAPVDTMFGSMPPVERPCFVCISEDQGTHFRALFSRDCRVAHNGVDLDFYRPLGVPRSGRFLFLARFSTVKSPDVCIDVCKRAGAELDLVGDVSITNEPEFLEQCKAACDGNRIKMVGPATRGNCVWWMSQSRGFLHLNSRFREPFGLAPVEAQLCGNGVLCWDYGAMRETVKHGETGFVVKSAEAAIEVIRSGALDALDRNRCREWASQFSYDRMISRYEQLCQEAIEGGGW